MEAINRNRVYKEVQVDASQETAFEVFTQKMDLWWPKTHHVGSCPMVESVLEGKQGGRWYSKHEDGSEVDIGYVLAWEPFARLVLAWQINGNYKFDPALITEVEVKFIVEGPKATRVTMEHRDMQKLTGGAKVVESMDEGWGMILNLYREVVNES